MKNIIVVALCVFLFSCQNSNQEKERKDENDDYDIWTVNPEMEKKPISQIILMLPGLIHQLLIK